jgi:ribose-phosphate pyrophosphokinase
MVSNSEIKIFTGNSNPKLAADVCRQLDVPMGRARVGTFSDGEIRVEIEDNVRGRDVFLVQSTCTPTNNNLMELLIMADACKRASAGRITAVVPYYGYARQDRKVAPRAPISAKLVADVMSVAGLDRVLTMELHAGQIQGYFNVPVDNLYSSFQLCNWLRDRMDVSNAIMVSPDAGGVERARAFAKHLGVGLAIIDKRRNGPNVAEVMHIIGDVKGKRAILVDDMIDTAGTITKAAAALKADGAQDVMCIATHPVLSGPASARLAESCISQVVVTDTIPLSEECAANDKIKVVSVAPIFAEAIRAIHHHDSVSRLFA